MPRNQNASNPSLRNRNRVTNKTRLKVIKGNIDADPIVLDEDEERARVVSTAGVDAEDANEHHLQAVLSAASHRATTLAQKATRASYAGKNVEGSTAFIPVPDAAGVVDNFAELYPPGRWTEPTTYVKFSNTVDESMLAALADGFTYAMDERDAEWLDKNNQEARGEGTSSQASASGTTTRSGGFHRSAKAKGKEAEPLTPVHLSENEFELVMGLFEKLTHDNTPFLHVSFQQQHGTCIPPFNDYHDVLVNDLSTSHFAAYMRPADIPPPQTLVRLARAVYPHWRERKIEREGHRIIPALNFDESDSKNESYICFRRREIKAIRKTRTAQVSSSDKLLRLKGELAHAYELARNILTREVHKRETQVEAKNVWEKRMALVDLKRRFPVFGGRDEEELLFDKERVPKKPKLSDPASLALRIKNRPNGDASASPGPVEPQMRPRDRHNAIQAAMDMFAKRIKEADHGWDDQIDTPYQQLPVSLPDRFFKCLRVDGASTPLASEERPRESQHLRLRRGRGGRMLVDRRRHNVRLTFSGADIFRFESRKSSNDVDMKLAEDQMNRIAERWRFDSAGEVGTDDEDRVLLDDFEPKHMRFQAQLEMDQDMLSTDTRLYLLDAQTGIYGYVNPLKPIHTAPQSRRDTGVYQHRPPLPVMQPMAVQQPVTPTVAQHNRTPTNAPQRPPSSASVHSMQHAAGPSSSPPSNQNNAAQSNGMPPQKSPVNAVPTVPAAVVNGVANSIANGVPNGTTNGASGSLAGLPNNASLTPTQQYAFNMQQKQNFQKVYVNYSSNAAGSQRTGQAVYTSHTMNGINGTNGDNVSLMGPVNMNLKLPAQRHMQWTSASQRPQPVQNGGDPSAMQNMQLTGLGGLLQAHTMPAVNGHLSPVRSAHSPQNAFVVHTQERTSPSHLMLNHSLSLSPHVGSSTQSQSQSQSHIPPTRNMQTPVPPSPTLLMQHQIPSLVGGMQSQGQGF